MHTPTVLAATYVPQEVDIDIGRVSIKGGSGVGQGTTISIDGHDLERVVRIALDIKPDEPLKVLVEMLA